MRPRVNQKYTRDAEEIKHKLFVKFYKIHYKTGIKKEETFYMYPKCNIKLIIFRTFCFDFTTKQFLNFPSWQELH